MANRHETLDLLRATRHLSSKLIRQIKTHLQLLRSDYRISEIPSTPFSLTSSRHPLLDRRCLTTHGVKHTDFEQILGISLLEATANHPVTQTGYERKTFSQIIYGIGRRTNRQPSKTGDQNALAK